MREAGEIDEATTFFGHHYSSSAIIGRFLISMAGVIFDPAQPDQAK